MTDPAAAWTSWIPVGSVIPVVLDYSIRLGMAAVVLVRKGRDPASASAWLVLVLAVPLLGALSYLLVGETRFSWRRIRRHREILSLIERPEYRATTDPAAAHPPLDPTASQIASLAGQVSESPAKGGNHVEIYGKTDDAVAAMVEAIDGAASHCHLLFYIWLDDGTGRRVAEALSRAAARGVACRVLVDALGSKGFLASGTCRDLRRSGVEVVAALPTNLFRVLFSRLDLRNHRKILVVDGTIGFTGSQNIADAAFAPKRRYAPWVDCMARLEGPAVRDLQLLFVEDWLLECTGGREELLRTFDPILRITPAALPDGVPVQVIGTGPNFQNEATSQIIQALIQVAREELVLTTPYFVPDQATLRNLVVAARRGVRVKLVLPARNDSRLVALASRGLYGPLLDAGVSIDLFQKGLLHAKTITVDRKIAVIMSANLDRRSYDLNFECGLLIYDCDTASQLRFLQADYLRESRPVERRQWRSRPIRSRLAEGAAAVLSPLL